MAAEWQHRNDERLRNLTDVADLQQSFAARAGFSSSLPWVQVRADLALLERRLVDAVSATSQPAASLVAFAAAVAGHNDFALTALHAATAACGSLVIALALLEGRLDASQAFAASQLDESFQIEAWGEDKEQAERRTALAVEIAAAARFMSLLRG